MKKDKYNPALYNVNNENKSNDIEKICDRANNFIVSEFQCDQILLERYNQRMILYVSAIRELVHAQ